MNSLISRRNQYGVLIAAALLCLATVGGCTSPRQYKINEAILIGERRQLEDEIYRLQFELRDALAENERLSAELDGASDDPSAKKTRSARVRNAAKASQEQPKSSIDENLYPGGDLLRTQPPANDTSVRYPEYPRQDMNAGAQLPDFAAVPNRARDAQGPNPIPSATARQAVYQSPRRSNGVSQVSYREAPSEDVVEEEERVSEEEREYAPEEDENAEEYVENEDENEAGNENAPSYDYDYDDELPDDAGTEWSPVPERR